MRSIPILIVSGLLFSVSAAGQTTRSVQGTVTDPQDAVVAAATIELLHTATNTTKTMQSTDAGSYVFDYLQPGVYVVKVRVPGFKTATVENVRVEATKTASVNVALEVGEVTESVQVEAGGQRVDTVNAQVATNVEQRFLRDLPSFTRNVLSFAEMQPGVSVSTIAVQGGSQMIDNSGTRANVNGNRWQRNGFYLDGMESGNWRNEALQMPNPDAVQELQVSTTNISAEYGRQVGGLAFRAEPVAARYRLSRADHRQQPVARLPGQHVYHCAHAFLRRDQPEFRLAEPRAQYLWGRPEPQDGLQLPVEHLCGT